MSKNVMTVILLWMFLTMSIQVNAQSDDPRPYDEWRLVDIQQDIGEMLDTKVIETYGPLNKESEQSIPSFFLNTFTLSPDGETLVGFASIVFGDIELNGEPAEAVTCVYHFNTDGIECYAQPYASRVAFEVNLTWSPDGQRLLLHPDWVRSNEESDIWLFDTADGSFQNLTDDGFDGQLTPENINENVWLDFTPVWNHTGDAFYFFRTYHDADHLDYNISLLRYTFNNGESETVVELTDQISDGLIFTSHVSLSPDGTHLVLTTPYSRDGSRTDIWILDIASGETLQHFDASVFARAVPDWFEREDIVISDMQWTADGSHLVGYVGADLGGEVALLIMNYFSIDATTGELQALNDVSQWPSRSEFYPFEIENYIPAPFAGLSSDKGTLLLWHRQEDNFVLSAAPTNMNGGVALLVGLDERPVIRERIRIIYPMASNGRLLVGNTLYTFE